MEWKELRAALRGLTVYREELETEIGRSVTGLLDALHRQDGEEALAAYTGLFAALCREEFQGLGDWLWDRLRFHESAYSLLIDQGGSDPVLEQAARQDVDTLVRLVGTGCSCFLDAIQALLPPEFAPVLAGLSQWRTGSPFDFDALTAFYREHGAGLYAKYRAFLWEDGSLIPVADPDCPHPVELLGYEQQRQQVLDNTRLLVAGRPSNNVLLFGDGGTGKSATVKSMLYLEGMEDLPWPDAARSSSCSSTTWPSTRTTRPTPPSRPFWRAGWRSGRSMWPSTPPPTGVTWYGRPSQSGRARRSTPLRPSRKRPLWPSASACASPI